MQQTDATTMTRYLLGQLPEAQRDLWEQEWFTDQAQYAQLCEAENALIDAYVRGDLRGQDRASFEQQFLTIPARRERVQTARALVQELDQRVIEPQPGAWWQRWFVVVRTPKLIPAMAMAIILLAGGLWLVWQRRELRQQIAESAITGAEHQRRVQELEQALVAERAANSRLTEELARTQYTPQLTPSPTSPALPTTLLFTLSVSVLRSESGAAVRPLKLSAGIARVQLQVPLPAIAYTRFAATLRTTTGDDIAQWPSVKVTRSKQGTASLLLLLSAKTLKAGDYVLVVSGIKAQRKLEEFRRLPFRVNQ